MFIPWTGPYSEKLKRQYANGNGSNFQVFTSRRSLLNPSVRLSGNDNKNSVEASRGMSMFSSYVSVTCYNVLVTSRYTVC